MDTLSFHPLAIDDLPTVRRLVYPTECRNCDLNFMNLLSWRFLYDTETALWNGWLLFRFKANGHRAYLAPVGQGDWRPVVGRLLDDADHAGQPFLMLGVCENSLARLQEAMPGYFHATCDRSYTDYIYLRASLASLAGKKLQPKRNHANRFARLYPGYKYLELTPDRIPECLELEQRWSAQKTENSARLSYADERRSMQTVFAHWNELDGTGGLLEVDGRIVAFTFGAPINRDTFDVCVEKADTGFDGAYAMINREFARRIPEQYIYLNREEDLGLEGLRRAKESYQPHLLLHKYTVMTKHPLGS